jgi:hypothetical protein
MAENGEVFEAVPHRAAVGAVDLICCKIPSGIKEWLTFRTYIADEPSRHVAAKRCNSHKDYQYECDQRR